MHYEIDYQVDEELTSEHKIIATFANTILSRLTLNNQSDLYHASNNNTGELAAKIAKECAREIMGDEGEYQE